MAKYVLAQGEVEVLHELAEGDRGNRRLPGAVILTDRRVVLLVARKSPGLALFVRPWLAQKMQQLAVSDLMGQIERDDFASVEPHRPGMLSFHSKGEGYGHISFVVYSMTPFEVWQQRMHQWAAGMLSAAPVPTARLVDR